MKDETFKKAINFCKKMKSKGIDKQMSWSKWIKEMSLSPKMDAKEFYEIYETTLPDTDHIELPDYLQTY